MKKYSILLFVLIISSIGSGIAFPIALAGIPIPGFLFGATILVWLCRKHKITNKKRILWLFGSTLAWEVAWFFNINKDFFGLRDDDLGYFTYTFESIIGTIILVFFAYLLAKRMNILQILPTLLIGLIGGTLFFIGMGVADEFIPFLIFILPFMFWQVPMGLALGYFLDQNLKDDTNPQINENI